MHVLHALPAVQPLEDCEDAAIWVGQGTQAASLCCGLNLGPAKNATIYSGAAGQGSLPGYASHLSHILGVS